MVTISNTKVIFKEPSMRLFTYAHGLNLLLKEFKLKDFWCYW